MATTTNTNYNIVTVDEVSFMNSEIVCLKDGRQFLPAEIEVVEDHPAQVRMQREWKILDRMIEAKERGDWEVEEEQLPIKVSKEEIDHKGDYGVILKNERFYKLEDIEIVD